MDSEVCGVVSQNDRDLINQISKLDPRLAVFSTTRGGLRSKRGGLRSKRGGLRSRRGGVRSRRGGARPSPSRNAYNAPTNDSSAETIDYLLAGIVFAGLLGVSYAAIQVIMIPQVASTLGVTLPCEGQTQQGVMQILSIIAQGVGKTCAQRQTEFDAYINSIKMLVLGGGTVGVLSGSFSLPSIAKLIHTARMSCVTKKVMGPVNLNGVNAKAREQIARGGKRKTRRIRKH